MRAGRVSLRAVLGAVCGFGLALLAAVSLPPIIGCRSLVVMSGSMEPAIHTGSVVIVQRITAPQIAVGEVVSFRDPEDGGRLVTHRVQAVSEQDGVIAVETRGDANTGSERWTIAPNGTVGRVRFQIPLLGYVFAPLQTRVARVLLIVVPALLLGLLLVVGIWRRGEASGGATRVPTAGRRVRAALGRTAAPAGRGLR